LENGYSNSFQQSKGLIAHLRETHNLKFECNEIVVKDMNGMVIINLKEIKKKLVKMYSTTVTIL
jgi:hypothetical protein